MYRPIQGFDFAKFKFVPPVDAPEGDVISWAKRFAPDRMAESPVRREAMWRFARNGWFYLGRHWIRTDDISLVPAVNGYVFQQWSLPSTAPFPMPVDNRIGIAVDARIARLCRKEYEPKVTPTRPVPEYEDLASIQQKILLEDLQEIKWPNLRENLAYDLTLYGVATARSCLYPDVSEQRVVADSSASFCPSCQSVYSSNRVLNGFADMGRSIDGVPSPLAHRNQMYPMPIVPGRPPESSFSLCPMCDQPTELQPFQPTPDDLASGATDTFGRSLGMYEPDDTAYIEAVSPFFLHVENGGVWVEPHSNRIWGVRQPRPIDWVAKINPEIANDLSPDPPEQMLRDHPFYGERFFGGPGVGDLLSNYLTVTEITVPAMPIEGLEQGRHIIMASTTGQLIYNGTLMVEVPSTDGSPSKQVPRVKFFSGADHRTPGKFWGKAPVDDPIPLNRQINQILAQMVTIREKGVPQLYLPPDVTINSPKDDAARALQHLTIDVGASPNFDIRSALFPAQPLTANPYMDELHYLADQIERQLGPASFEIGKNPVGVQSGFQLQVLAEETAQKLSSPERVLTGIMEGIFDHYNTLVMGVQRERTLKKYGAMLSTNEIILARRAPVVGATKVEAKGTFDRSVFQAGQTEKGIQMGIIDISTTEAKAEAAQYMGIPTLDDRKSIQLTNAERIWSDFIATQEVPVLDETVIAPDVYWQILGKRWEGERGKAIQRAVGWQQVLSLISGWDKKLKEAEQRDAVQKAMYEGLPLQIATQRYQQLTSLALQSGGQVQAPPPPPVNGRFLPEDRAQRILAVLRSMAQPLFQPMNPMQPPLDPVQGKNLMVVLQFYAVIQQCRLASEERALGAAMGMPSLPTPGAPAPQPPPAGQPQPRGLPGMPTAPPQAQAAAGGGKES